MIQARYTLPLSKANIWVIQENEEQSPVSDKRLNSTAQGKFCNEFFPAQTYVFLTPWDSFGSEIFPLSSFPKDEWAEHSHKFRDQWLGANKQSPGKAKQPGTTGGKGFLETLTTHRAGGGHTPSILWEAFVSQTRSVSLDSAA